MSTGAIPRHVRFKDDALTKSSERSSAAAVPSATRPSGPAKSNSGNQSNSDRSLWTIPGIDKNTFYAAALFLHTLVGQLEGLPWFRGPMTDQATRDFLDRLADCFARSKLRDRSDHVSATAMVRDEEHKKITLYIAKNRSSKGTGAKSIGPQKRLGDDGTENENKEFAEKMVSWFNNTIKKHADEDEREVAGAYSDEPDKDECDEDHAMFEIICGFNHSRLEHYIEKTSTIDIESLMRALPLDRDEKINAGVEYTKAVVDACKDYQERKAGKLQPVDLESNKPQTLITCAILANQVRKRDEFRKLAEKIETSKPDSQLKRHTKAIDGVKYLGRLRAAYISFLKFCKSKQQKNYSFVYVLLPSQEDAWTGQSYMEKILSWPGDLGLDEDNIRADMAKIVNEADTAPVHCEMQLMMYFLREGAPKPYDWFGCSKKSCWLCWHMMIQNQKFSMKDTHRKLYPRWALSFDFSKSQPQVAEGLKTAYDQLISLVQAKVIRGKDPRTLVPYLQSSARMTPHHPDEKDGLVQFLGEIIELPAKYNRIPSRTVPALHFPQNASSKDVRHVTVNLYQRSEIDKRFPIDCPDLNGTQVALAFQLMTLPNIVDLQQSYSLLEHHAWTWQRLTIPHVWSPRSERTSFSHLYCRADEISLAPNLFLLETWKTVHGEVYTPEKFPWRGDVFVICTTDLEDPFSQTYLVDDSIYFEHLAHYFRRKGPHSLVRYREDYRKRDIEFIEMLAENEMLSEI